MLIQRRSQATGAIHSREVAVTQEQYDAWQRRGVLIQDAMPDLPREDREYLISGTTPEEWVRIFGKMED